MERIFIKCSDDKHFAKLNIFQKRILSDILNQFLALLLVIFLKSLPFSIAIVFTSFKIFFELMFQFKNSEPDMCRY